MPISTSISSAPSHPPPGWATVVDDIPPDFEFCIPPPTEADLPPPAVAWQPPAPYVPDTHYSNDVVSEPQLPARTNNGKSTPTSESHVSGAQVCFGCIETMSGCEVGQIREQNGAPCSWCEAGSVPSASLTECERCIRGRYASTTTWKCELCPRGSSPPSEAMEGATGPGELGCGFCKPGTIGVLDDLLQANCVPCPQGTRGKGGDAACEPCPDGLTSAPGSEHCALRVCEPGSTRASPAASGGDDGNDAAGTVLLGECILCGVGTYSNVRESPACELCGLHSETTQEGSTHCTLCGRGRFSRFNGSMCVSCDEREDIDENIPGFQRNALVFASRANH